jgi:Cu/Ag efflux pump CusA
LLIIVVSFLPVFLVQAQEGRMFRPLAWTKTLAVASLLYVVFHSATEAVVLIVPTIYALTGGLVLQWLLHYNFSVAVWVGYIARFGIAVETGIVMVVYLHEALDQHLREGRIRSEADIEAAVIDGAVHRLRPKLMTCAPFLRASPQSSGRVG